MGLYGMKTNQSSPGREFTPSLRAARRLHAALLVFLISALLLCPYASADNDSVQNARNSVVRVVELFYTNGELCAEGYGTGIVVGDKSEQYVLTNRHVVDWEDTVSQLRTASGRSDVSATLYILSEGHAVQTIPLTTGNIILSSSDDLALIRLPEKLRNKKPAVFGNSSDVKVTENVYAIGFPSIAEDYVDKSFYDTNRIESLLVQAYPSETKDMTISKGTVSKTDVRIDGDMYIQHEANITHGSSGGPLVDENGHVIGINTMGFVDSEASRAFYAIDVYAVRRFLESNGVPFSKGTKLGGTIRRYLIWIIAAIILLFAAREYVMNLLHGPSRAPSRPGSISDVLTMIYSSSDSDKPRVLTNSDYFIEQLKKNYRPEFKRDCQLLEKASRSGLGKIIIQYQNQNSIPGDSDRQSILSELVNRCGFTQSEAARAMSLFFEMVGWSGSVPASRPSAAGPARAGASGGGASIDLSDVMKNMYRHSDKNRLLDDPDYFIEQLSKFYRPEFKADCQLLEKAARSGLGSIVQQYIQQGAEPNNFELDHIASELSSRCGFSREDARRAVSLYGGMVGWSRC